VSPEWIEEARRGLPELPRARVARFEREHGLSREDARAIADAERRGRRSLRGGGGEYADKRKIANWFRGELFRALKDGERSLAISR